MKKFTTVFFVALLTAMTMVSCDKEDDDDEDGGDDIGSGSVGNNTLLIRKWYYFSDTYGSVTDMYDHLCPTKKDFVEFKANNTFTTVDHDEDCTVMDTYSGSWTRSGNNLTANLGGFSQTAAIIELTNTRLRLMYTEGGITYIETYTSN